MTHDFPVSLDMMVQKAKLRQWIWGFSGPHFYIVAEIIGQ